jgi:hypothetical protein
MISPLEIKEFTTVERVYPAGEWRHDPYGTEGVYLYKTDTVCLCTITTTTTQLRGPEPRQEQGPSLRRRVFREPRKKFAQ